MIIDCISDLHGEEPELSGGDLLIIAGDLTARDAAFQHIKFLLWLDNQKYKKKIFISGNHDQIIERMGCSSKTLPENTEYLCDSGTEFEGFKIWGSPWTHLFEGVNPNCTAFMIPEEKLDEKWDLFPEEIDILITHSPPFGILDEAQEHIPALPYAKSFKRCGSKSLCHKILTRPQISLHVFGHIHESYGKTQNQWGGISVNASIMNRNYESINKPIRIIL